jgi:O-antigen biosynthesis protein
VRRWLLERGEAPGRIRLVESGVDLERLRPAPRSAELVRRIGAAPGDAIVGFAGRWSEEKDPLAFVEMVRRVDSSLPVRFVMAGTGHLRPHIERAVADAGFPEGRFHLLGDVPDIAPVLASLDLLVVPSRLDGRPVVALEALALGVPVLASRIGALPDLVEEGETGWLCEPGDVEAFARRVEGAVAAREELARMRPRARAFAEAHLDARAMLAAYHDALRSLLPDHHPAEDGPAMPVAEPGGEGRGASPG